MKFVGIERKRRRRKKSRKAIFSCESGGNKNIK
jgi:hypothetical protein